jgi:acetoin utilization deacetylase AcuC-like enzyme
LQGDGERRDPLGGLNLVEADFAWAAARLMEIAERHAKGRIVSVLEGGYHLEGLARSAAAHVAALMGDGVRTTLRVRSGWARSIMLSIPFPPMPLYPL